MLSAFFKKYDDSMDHFTLVAEEAKSEKEAHAVTLTKITVTITDSRYFSTWTLSGQFKNRFDKGAVYGVLPQIIENHNDRQKPVLQITFELGATFKQGDQTFRTVVSELSQLSLRAQDALISEYERCLAQYHIVSELGKKVHKHETHFTHIQNNFSH